MSAERIHIAQHLAAYEAATDVEAVVATWDEWNQAPYLEEAGRLIAVADALAAYRAATAITGVVPA